MSLHQETIVSRKLTNHAVAFEVSVNGVSGWVRVTIPVGNYTKDSIPPILKGLIDTALAVTSTVTFNSNLPEANFSSNSKTPVWRRSIFFKVY